MPRYFFNIDDGSRETDREGTDLADLDAARREAVVFVGETLRHKPIWNSRSLTVDVTDGQGRPLFVVSVVVADCSETESL